MWTPVRLVKTCLNITEKCLKLLSTVTVLLYIIFFPKTMFCCNKSNPILVNVAEIITADVEEISPFNYRPWDWIIQFFSSRVMNESPTHTHPPRHYCHIRHNINNVGAMFTENFPCYDCSFYEREFLDILLFTLHVLDGFPTRDVPAFPTYPWSITTQRGQCVRFYSPPFRSIHKNRHREEVRCCHGRGTKRESLAKVIFRGKNGTTENGISCREQGEQSISQHSRWRFQQNHSKIYFSKSNLIRWLSSQNRTGKNLLPISDFWI